MKRTFSILLITALLVALMPLMSTVALAEEYATITSENGYGVRLREGPSKAYNPLGTFDVGMTVTVLQRGDEWSQLQIGDTVGWMMNQYLVFGVTGSAGSTGAVANAYVYSPDGLRVWLRATPGGTRLFLNATGTPVSVLESGDDWCKVSINGTIGYMMTKYLYFEKVDPVDYQIESVNINYYYPVVGDTLIAAVEPASATVTYEWYVDGALLGTEPTFEVLTRYANQTIKVKVTGTGNYYGSAVDTVYPVQINKGIKSVSLSQNVPVVGEELSAVLQPTSATVDYSWRVGGVEVSSAATYTPTEDDIGKLIQLKVTGISGFSGSAACTADHVVISDKVVQYVELSNEYPVVGEVLTAEVYPSSADVNMTWYADGEVVSVVSSYKVQYLDLGKKIKVVVEGVEPYSGTVQDISANVAGTALESVSITSSQVLAGNGEWIVANVEPRNASAYYYWYVGEDTLIASGYGCSLELTDALVKKYDLLGKQIWVSAVGTGVYTGSVVSDLSGELVTNKKVTEVAIDNLTPVVGDTLSVTLAPDNLNDVQDQLTYVWMVGTETKTGYNKPTYTVQYTDANKPIRVKVIGANGYTGEAYSAYTANVLENSWLTDVYIYNLTSDEYATRYSPETGHKLCAFVSPVGANGVYTGNYTNDNGYANDFVTYTWYVKGAAVATGDTLLVQDAWEGEKITVVASANEDSYYYYPDYTVSATTQKVIALDAMNVAINLERPQVGVAPDYDPWVYVSEELGYHDAYVSVEWLREDGFNPAEFDVYGCFLPGITYVAKLTVIPKENVSLYGDAVSVVLYDDGMSYGSYYVAEQSSDGSTRFYVTFETTGSTTINDLYIADLAAPVVGGTMDTFCSNDQLIGNVTWSYTEDQYTACIEVTPYVGYTLEGVEDNAFDVAGATKTIYEAGSDVIWAIFDVGHELEIQSDKDVVYLDGYNRRIVQCSAHLSNYMGKLENVKWEVVDAHVDGTSINKNGQLIIGMYEETDQEMVVRATVTVGSKTYVAEKTIYIYSGTDTDTALKVIFTKYNAEITRGGRGYFEAVVSNSSDGCTLFALYKDGTSKPITDGWLYVPTNMDDEYIIVKGISNEDHSVACTMLVTLTGEITDPSTDISAPRVEFTQSYAVVERGSTVTYKAESIGTLNDDTVIYITWPNGTMEVLKNGNVSIADDAEIKGFTITAYSVDDPMLSDSVDVIIVDPAEITFTKSASKVERGRSYQFEAIARRLARNVQCDLYADFGSGDVKLPGGVLTIDSLEKASNVTITAVCPEDETVRTSMTATIYDARKVEFTQSVVHASKGGYPYTFAAKATVYGQTYDCDIYADFGAGESKLADGKLTVAADEAADSVVVTAKYTCADGEVISESMTVSLSDKGYIEFVSGPTTVEHGDEATYKAVAYIYEDIKDCEIFAIWPDGTEEKLTDGLLKISDTELRGSVTIKAVYDLGKPTEMVATRSVTIKPDVYIAFDDGMPRQLKRDESFVFSAKAYFKNTTVPAKIYADYSDGKGYIELADGKVEASKSTDASLTIKAQYETITPAYLTITVKDLPTIIFTESKDKVEVGSTTHFAAKAIVDGVEYPVDALYADGEYMVGDNLVITEWDERTQVTVKAEYRLDADTTLTTEKVVKIYPKASVKFTQAPSILIRGAGEAQYVAEATVLGETKPAAIYADFGYGYFDVTDGKLAIGADELANEIKIKAEYAESGVVLAAKEITVAIKDPLKITWEDSITEVEHDKSYTFAAKAKLPDETLVDCKIFVDGAEAAGGKYDVSATETRSELTIKAVYELDGVEHSITKTVTLKETPYIEFVAPTPSTVTAGETVTFKAEAVFPTTRVPAKIFFGSEEAVDGKYTLPEDSGALTLSATAVYEGLESKEYVASIKRIIRFVDIPEQFMRGETYEVKALVNKFGTDYQANLSVPGCTVSGSMVTVPADFAGSSVTITASYAGVDDKSVTVNVVDNATIAFTAKTDKIGPGKYEWVFVLPVHKPDSFTFKAEATVGGVKKAADIYQISTYTNVGGTKIGTGSATITNENPRTERTTYLYARYNKDGVDIKTEPITVKLEQYVSGASMASLEVDEPALMMAARPSSVEENAAEEEADDTIEIVVDTEEPVVEEETEEVVTEPVVEEETDDTIEIVVDTEEPVVEEETEEVVTEPVVEEEADDTIEIVVDTEEPVVEEETEEVVTEPVVEEEADDTIVIVVDTTEPVAEEETEADETEAAVEEEPVEEEPETIVIVVDTTEPVEEEEVEAEEEAEEEKPSKKDRKNRKAEEEVIEIEEDETLDALEGDDIGESAESESSIKISFTKRANKIKLGNYSTFQVNVSGSDEGVIWSLRLSEDVNGEPVSSIDQDGRLTVSLDEKSEKLIVVATSREDHSVRARWIVEVTEEDVEETDAEEVIDESAVTEEETTEEAVTEEDAMAEAAMAEENKTPEEPAEETAEIEEELITVEEGASLLDMF